MSIITLTTDYGIKDHFVASVKGRVLSALSAVKIVDISHCIDLYNVAAASYVLFGAYKDFPKNTIHWVLVEAEMYDQESFLLARINGHFFLTANNGVISLLTTEEDEIEIVDLEIPQFCSNTVALYLYVTQQIIAGSSLQQLGNKIVFEDYEIKKELVPIANENEIIGAIIYEDHYGNAVTNISEKLFQEVKRNRKFRIEASRYHFKRISEFYSDSGTDLQRLASDKFVIFNDSGFLQISIYKSYPGSVGSVRTLMGLSYRDVIKVEFFD